MPKIIVNGEEYKIVTDKEVLLKNSEEMKWLDRVSKVYWFGSGTNSTTQNGYYKICSVVKPSGWLTYGIKLRMVSDNFANFQTAPVEFFVVAQFNDSAVVKIQVFGDPNSLLSPLFKENLFCKYPTNAIGAFEIYYKRTIAYGEINVEVLQEFARRSDNTAPFVSTGIWTMGDNTLVADIASANYTVSPLSDSINSAVFTAGSNSRPVYIKNGVPTPITNILQLVDGTTVQNVLQLYDDGDENTNYGGNLIVQGSGNTFIGGGESPFSLFTEYENNGTDTGSAEVYAKTSENMYIASDSHVHIFSGCQKLQVEKVLY